MRIGYERQRRRVPRVGTQFGQHITVAGAPAARPLITTAAAAFLFI
jgi:hypothetical protein